MVTSLKARLAAKWKAEREAAGIYPPYRNPFIIEVNPEPKDPAFEKLVKAIERAAKKTPRPPKQDPKAASAVTMRAAGWSMSQARDKNGRLK